MGRECKAMVTYGKQRGEAVVLLESRELILRGAIKARVQREALTQVSATSGGLQLLADGVPLAVAMTAVEAARWAAAIAKPPPSLAAKLGVRPARPALVLGDISDPELSAALAGATTGERTRAVVLIAMIETHADLATAQAIAETTDLPLWCVYPKGKAADPGDGIIRSALRGSGFIDSKACSVSERLTATRYARSR